MRTSRLLFAAALAVSLLACSDDDDAASSSTATDSTAGTQPATTGTAPTTTEAAASPTTAGTSAPTSPPATTVAAPAAAPGYPAQPAGVSFPAGDWPTAPLPGGVDQATIDAAVDAVMGAPDALSGVRSVVVVQGGSIVYERYHASSGPETVFSSFSVGKSFTSAIIGLLVDDGALALDESPPRPEWPAGDPRAAITLRQLLQMSSGLEWTEEYGPESLALRMLGSPSAAALMAAQPLEREPGSEFEYSTGTSALVAGIAADAVGGCGALDTYLHERLLDPIGITSETIIVDGGGCYVGGIGMDMTTRDFARFGLLYLRGGVWDGTQVMPTSWIDETRVPAATQPRYGLHWWLSTSGEVFAAVGLGGQQVAVIPDADLVIGVNSTLGNDLQAAALVGQIATAFGAPA